MSAERGRKLRQPADVQPLEWHGRDEFFSARAEWLEAARWDYALAPAAFRVLAEIAGKLGPDRSNAWPSIPWLAASLGMSSRHVKRAISQSVERGWVLRQKRGFGGSNHYVMSSSPSVAQHVLAEHNHRLTAFVETRRLSMGPSTSPMDDASNGAISVPSMGPSTSPQWGHPCPPIPINDPCQISPSTGPLGATEQDRASRLATIEALGEGNSVLGEERARMLAPAWLAHLVERVSADGLDAAADAIEAACQFARGQSCDHTIAKPIDGSQRRSG